MRGLFTSTDRAALVGEVGPGAAEDLVREVEKTLRALRANPLAAIWKAERRALVTAERLVCQLRDPTLELSLLPGKERLLADLEEFLPFMRGSSRNARVRQTRRLQNAHERRSIEYVFLDVLERHKVRHGGPRAARALGVVLKAALNVPPSDLDDQRRALMTARRAWTGSKKNTEFMETLLRESAPKRRSARPKTTRP